MCSRQSAARQKCRICINGRALLPSSGGLSLSSLLPLLSSWASTRWRLRLRFQFQFRYLAAFWHLKCSASALALHADAFEPAPIQPSRQELKASSLLLPPFYPLLLLLLFCLCGNWITESVCIECIRHCIYFAITQLVHKHPQRG